MTDREQVITTLTEHLDHWKRLLSEGVCTKDEGERTILSLAIAIESIQADSTHDLTCETADFIVIPEGATLGDMVMLITEDEPMIDVFGNPYMCFTKSQWDSPYRKEN